MAITTRAELFDAVQRWTNRGDMTSHLSDMLALTEASIRRTLRTLTLGPETVTVDTNGRGVLPAACAELRSAFRQGEPRIVGALSVTSPSMLAQRAERPAVGAPSLAAVVGRELRVYPVPETPIGVGVTYYATVPDLTDAAPTNWLLAKAPDVYLYGMLAETAPFLMEDDRIPTWLGRFDRALAELERERQAQEYGSDLLGDDPSSAPWVF